MKLKRARKAKGLSQYALAKAAGVSREYVRMLEAGKYDPTVWMLEKLARALGLPVTELLELNHTHGPRVGDPAPSDPTPKQIGRRLRRLRRARRLSQSALAKTAGISREYVNKLLRWGRYNATNRRASATREGARPRRWGGCWSDSRLRWADRRTSMTHQTDIDAATDESNNQFLQDASPVGASDCSTATLRAGMLSGPLLRAAVTTQAPPGSLAGWAHD